MSGCEPHLGHDDRYALSSDASISTGALGWGQCYNFSIRRWFLSRSDQIRPLPFSKPATRGSKQATTGARKATNPESRHRTLLIRVDSGCSQSHLNPHPTNAILFLSGGDVSRR